jgi:cytoskeletal protein CcmA (bactofilin family)
MSIFGKSAETKQPEPAPTAPKAATATPPAAPSRGACVIGSKTTVKGDLLGDEDVLVEGRVEGQIRISKDLRIGVGGNVKASIEASAIVIAGECTGDCAAVQRVEIQSTGKLNGNIRAPRIVIAEGATFRGNSEMTTKR